MSTGTVRLGGQQVLVAGDERVDPGRFRQRDEVIVVGIAGDGRADLGIVDEFGEVGQLGDQPGLDQHRGRGAPPVDLAGEPGAQQHPRQLVEQQRRRHQAPAQRKQRGD